MPTTNADLNSTLNMAPIYTHHRHAVDAVDTLPETNRKHGVNASRHKVATVQVIPSASANPNVAVLWWSEAASKFVQDNPALTKTGVGAGVGYEFSIAANGRIFYVAITGGIAAADIVDVYVAGSDAELVGN